MSILEWFARTFMAMNVDLEMIWGTMFLPHSSNAWLFGMLIHLIVSGLVGLIYALGFETITRASAWLGIVFSVTTRCSPASSSVFSPECTRAFPRR